MVYGPDVIGITVVDGKISMVACGTEIIFFCLTVFLVKLIFLVLS